MTLGDARCATRLCHVVRQAPLGAATLADDDLRVDFSAVTTPRDTLPSLRPARRERPRTAASRRLA